ncbi:hypothetical protein I4U23_027725 [Adineta vaga]|nr:hypothetical protein I4U23_027725 [Adineta vaga]
MNGQLFTDDTGVTIQRVNNELLALTETIPGYIIDENTLDTVGPLVTLPYAEELKTEILTLTTAHVMYDSKRKMTVGYATRMTRSNGQWLDVIFIYDNEEQNNLSSTTDFNNNEADFDEGGRFLSITRNMNERGKKYNNSIKSQTKSFRYNYEHGASYMHSASITEDYLILSEIPLHFSLKKSLGTLLSGKVLTDMFKWNESLPTYFRIINLDNGEEIARISGPGFFTFHHINAYQMKDSIIIDICAYDDHRLVKELSLNKLRENIFPSGLGFIRRFHLNLNTKRCTEPFENVRQLSHEQTYPISYKNSLVPIQIDLPRINSNFTGKFYRFIYAVRGPPNYFFDALVKIDIESQQVTGLWKEPCTSPSEPIFVPKPESLEEDDGIILTIIFEQQTNKSFILLLDAKTFQEITRAYLPVHIPFSLHGNFYN